jgi:hypothetical protein
MKESKYDGVIEIRKQLPNDTIVPIPVNYIYSPDQYNLISFVPSADAFATSNYALHE